MNCFLHRMENIEKKGKSLVNSIFFFSLKFFFQIFPSSIGLTFLNPKPFNVPQRLFLWFLCMNSRKGLPVCTCFISLIRDSHTILRNRELWSNLWLYRQVGTSLLKTLWEKEKMLVTSIFPFSHNIFFPIKDKSKHLCYIYICVCKLMLWEKISSDTR